MKYLSVNTARLQSTSEVVDKDTLPSNIQRQDKQRDSSVRKCFDKMGAFLI